MEDSTEQDEQTPTYNLLGDLFNRLAQANMNIGQIQAFNQVAAQAASTEIAEVKATAELQQDYLLDRLKQCQDAAAARSEGVRDVSDDDFELAEPSPLRSGWSGEPPEEECTNDIKAASEDDVNMLSGIGGRNA